MVAASGTRGMLDVAIGRKPDVLTLLELLQLAAGTEHDREFPGLRPGELERSYMHPSRVERKLDWTAGTTVEQGIPETYESLVDGFETVAAR